MTEQTIKQQQHAEAEAMLPTFTLNDLAAMIQLIDVVSERGAFKGPELEAVGVLRSRLARFLQANTPAAPEGAEEQAQQEPLPAAATE